MLPSSFRFFLKTRWEWGGGTDLLSVHEVQMEPSETVVGGGGGVVFFFLQKKKKKTKNVSLFLHRIALFFFAVSTITYPRTGYVQQSRPMAK